jgi:hypothetical protein
MWRPYGKFNAAEITIGAGVIGRSWSGVVRIWPKIVGVAVFCDLAGCWGCCMCFLVLYNTTTKMSKDWCGYIFVDLVFVDLDPELLKEFNKHAPMFFRQQNVGSQNFGQDLKNRSVIWGVWQIKSFFLLLQRHWSDQSAANIYVAARRQRFPSSGI